MPQMMPLGWMTLFTMFSATLITFAAMNYYTMVPKSKSTTKEMITKKTMNWKW
uniref:ATP synthase complex subunit 8 n=1 Tax=Allotermes sp. TaxID=2942750 RepID=A0A8X8M3B4_9NEOP|nr:ATP synthase F0 subunit 8 [Allotermes cf. paradoxus]URX53918.1 ATP synthase F0 subunit 8 [Allotermes sp.]